MVVTVFIYIFVLCQFSQNALTPKEQSSRQNTSGTGRFLFDAIFGLPGEILDGDDDNDSEVRLKNCTCGKI